MLLVVGSLRGSSAPREGLPTELPPSPILGPLTLPQGLDGSEEPSMVFDVCFSPAVNPCCYYPCQNQGVCVRYGLDSYQCDCTRTGYSGPNCTTREPGPHPTPPLLSFPVSLDPPRRPHFLPSSLSVATFSFLAWPYLLAWLLHELLLLAHPHSLVLGSVVWALWFYHLPWPWALGFGSVMSPSLLLSH